MEGRGNSLFALHPYKPRTRTGVPRIDKSYGISTSYELIIIRTM
jgi:hypothetical protein